MAIAMAIQRNRILVANNVYSSREQIQPREERIAGGYATSDDVR